ncbi:MAG: 2Fe-2S iron-sulfur cluster binding domain-containing protein [Betaproteobacteria bacterium]|nr:2Fe-2S iron-sulfur cluster binding domain-containing protein [Betaproteobacteria bacterium]
MSHQLPLSRVARLVGVPRSTLQAMIHHGEIATFDGMIDLDELLRVFPDVRWEDDGEVQHVTEIKEKAYGKRLRERVLPSQEILAERLFEMGKEYAAAQSLLHYQQRVLGWLEDRFQDAAERGGAPVAQAVQDLRQWLREQWAAAPAESGRALALLAKENLMRLMTAHVRVQPSGEEFFVEGNNTVLEAALRSGLPLKYGCSNGHCGACKARLTAGQVTKVHPHDFVLSERDRADGHFLMCSYTAVSDLVIEAGEQTVDGLPEQEIDARVQKVELIDDMCLIHLLTPRSQRLQFLSGQRVELGFAGLRAEYPVASCPCEDRRLEFHIPRANTPFVREIFTSLKKEDVLHLHGPSGRFVLDMTSTRPVLLVAWGAGFAPIKSLIQQIFNLEQAASIHLVWAALADGHYLDNLCRSWADALDNLRYSPIQSPDAPSSVAQVALLAEDLKDWDVYAAGPADFVAALREMALGAGLLPERWHAEICIE